MWLPLTCAEVWSGERTAGGDHRTHDVAAESCKILERRRPGAMRLLAAHVWNMDEQSYPRRAVAAGLGGAPAEIVAEVLAGITRDGHGQPGASCGHEQALSGRAQGQRRRSANRDCAGEGEVPFHIRHSSRERIARARLDAHVLRARGKPEHDQCFRSFAFEQRRHIPVDGLVAHSEYVDEAAHIGKARVPSAGKLLRQWLGRIKGRAGKWTKTCDEESDSHG